MGDNTYSPKRELIRQRYYKNAQSKEKRLKDKLSNDISNLGFKDNLPVIVCIGLFVGCGIVGAIIGRDFLFFLVGGAGGLVIYFLLNSKRIAYNSNLKKQRHQLEDDCEKEIKKIYSEADRLADQEIKKYELEIMQFYKRIMNNKKSIDSMVQHNTDMFQRMISHSPKDKNIPFLEAVFIFEVEKKAVVYKYQSEYTNPLDDYNFDKNRFYNLNTNAECEGLAAALSKLTIERINSLYHREKPIIKKEHTDAEVTLFFKATNKNFVPAKPIGG